ncbi:MAG TPA: hypothetical protein ENI23_15400 [bacterium]|nr:hypothetical protein [bacterium]
MSQMVTALTVLVCINVALVIGGFSLSSDLTRIFYTFDAENNIQGYTSDFNASIPKSVLIAGQGEGGGEAQPSDFRITDVLKTLFAALLFLFDVAFAPISFFTSPTLNFPIEIRFMLAAPIGIIMFFLVLNWWRGSD